jgi:glutamate-1-semialdehyde 2,1-aminomutase
VWTRLSEKHGLHVHVKGVPPLSSFALDHGQPAQALSTLFTQEMLARGFLASKAFYATYAHTSEHVERYAVAVDDVFAILRKALDAGDVEGRLKGPLQHTGFARLA